MSEQTRDHSMGVVYIATGPEFVREAEISVRTLRNSMPEVDVTLICDEPSNCDYFNEVITIEDPEYGFEDQILNLERSPYDYTIYLDTDIYVDDDIGDLFDLLDSFDIGLAHSATRKAWDIEGLPDCFPEYNSGVIAYRNDDEFSDFISRWRSVYFSGKEGAETMQNQPSLRRALYETNLRIATLPPEYNCRFYFPGQVVGQVKLFHGRLLPVEGPGAGNYFDIEEAVDEINKTDKPRVFTQLGGITVHTNKEDSLIHRARLSYRKHGLKHVLREGYKLVFQKSN